jgi:hypothetical protein
MATIHAENIPRLNKFGLAFHRLGKLNFYGVVSGRRVQIELKFLLCCVASMYSMKSLVVVAGLVQVAVSGL